MIGWITIGVFSVIAINLFVYFAYGYFALSIMDIIANSAFCFCGVFAAPMMLSLGYTIEEYDIGGKYIAPDFMTKPLFLIERS